MTNNFKIVLNQQSADLYLRLKGDFDGNAAFELMDIIKKHCRFATTAYLNTDGLKHIYPFGAAVWQSHIGELNPCNHLHLQFSGKHARELAIALGKRS